MVTSNDEPWGQSWVSFWVSFMEVGTFLRGLCSQRPNLVLDVETIFNPSFSDSAGQLFRELCRPVCDIWSHRFKVREWDGGREENKPGVPGGGVTESCPCHPSYFVATLEGLQG